MPTLPGQAGLVRRATLASNAASSSNNNNYANDQVAESSNASPVSNIHRSLSTAVAGLATPLSTLRSQSVRSLPENPVINSDEASKTARLRRRMQAHQLEPSKTLGDHVDNAVVTAAEAAQEHWVLRSCLDRPFCQRICFPAEYATQSKQHNGDANASGSKSEQGQEQKHTEYKYPDFTAAGFSVVSNEDSNWVDPMVPERLGLQLATHRRTSVQRLVYVINKGKLASHTTPQEVTHLIRALKRCDHVNILQVHEVFEDHDSLYIMYESFPCCTLRSQLESHKWTQAQIVNIARECCAAVAYCSDAGLRLIGWTLCHVLLPAKAAENGDPGFCKVFGFGLLGTLVMNTYDHLLWGPEALEKFRQQNGVHGNFLLRLEGPQLVACDCWSLGAIIYSLVARRPPAATEEAVLAKRWSFTLAIDDVDMEARTLIEGFLHNNAEKRLRPERALHHEWVRKNWRAMPGADEVFMRLEEFVNKPLTKKTFAKFLIFFLDAEHFLKIAENFYRLDMVGNGVIQSRELEIVAKRAGRPDQAAKAVHNWFAREGDHISLQAFAECYAEEVIDGKALRHAFESLDDDGSQQISAEELFHALKGHENSLTKDDIIKHINAAELDVSDSTCNNNLDYGEFVRLFPERERRTAQVVERLENCSTTAQDLTQRFKAFQEEVEEWITGLDGCGKKMAHLITQTLARSEIASEAVKDLNKVFNDSDHALKKVPGPELDPDKMPNRKVKAKHSKKKASSKEPQTIGLGYDTYLMDLAVKHSWPLLLQTETNALKNMMRNTKTKNIGQTEQIKAHDAGDVGKNKLEEVLNSARGQYEEYLAFCDVMEFPEAQLNCLSISGRALPPRSGEMDEDDLLLQAADDDEEEQSHFMAFVKKVRETFASR